MIPMSYFLKNPLINGFIVFLLAICTSCGGENIPTVMHENDEEQIFFSSNRDGDWDIYQMGEKSFFAKKILNNSVYDFNPVNLQLNKKILFTSTFDKGATIQKRVENGDGTFSMVEFETFQDDEIFISDYDGSALEALTENSGCSDYGASWSSQSLKIAYSKNCDHEEGSSHIYLMNPDGSDTQQLTSLSGESWDPKWSPDGQRIVFSHKPNNSENWSVHIINVDGSGLIALNNAQGWKPSWAPNKDQIAFTSNTEGFWNIYITNTLDKEPTMVTENGSDSTNPVWSPNGEKIAFADNRFGEFEIFIYNLLEEKLTRTGQSGIPSDWTHISD